MLSDIQFEPSVFEVNGRQHAVVRVLAFRVVEEFDVFKHVLPCSVACLICAASYPFPFLELKEALCDGVIVTVPTSDNRTVQSMNIFH